jgi:hypothetical protein
MTKKANRPGSSLEVHYESVLGDISNVIDAARKSVARSVNLNKKGKYGQNMVMNLSNVWPPTCPLAMAEGSRFATSGR